jgi:ABC-type sulfate transport system permease component
VSVVARSTDRVATVLSALAASLLLLFLAAPTVGLVGAAGATGLRRLASDGELRGALALTTAAATVATLLAFAGGTPLAYILARRRFRGRAILAAVLDLPLLIPHPVAGIALLLVLGRESPIGRVLLEAGIRITGSRVGIVCAMLFVSAPLFVSAARESFARVDARYEAVARTLGDSPWRAFRRVTLPLTLPGVIAGSLLVFIPMMGEYLNPVILGGDKTIYVGNLIGLQFGTSRDWPFGAAIAMVLIALMTVVVLVYTRLAAREEQFGG